MELAQLRDVLKAQLFKPFTMSLVDGRRYFVPHPEFLYVPPAKKHTMIFYNNDETEAVSILDAIMVTSIEFGDTRLPKPPNGINGSNSVH